jgi:hypothetical protein
VYNSATGIWENSSVAIPSGGTAGQVLSKASDSSYSVAWVSGTQVPTSTVKHIVRNDSGGTLTKGTVVYTSGANGTHILVKPALATADQSSAQVVGFLEVDLAHNADGYAISEGLLGDINTSAANAEGDPIWLSSTVAGGVNYGFANEPYAPTHLVYLGVVTRKNANNGQIFIRISNGWELGELHNVNIDHANALADKHILQYEDSSKLWKNTSLGSNSLYIGTTQIALNRATASQALTGITSIDGSAATLTTSRTLWGQSFNGSANVTGSLTSVGDITGSGAVTITAGGTNTNIVLAPNGTGTVDFSSKNITSVGTITATTFSGALSGNATSATTFAVTNDVATSSAVYPVWVTANTGNNAGKVSSTALSFVPSTGTLTTTTFSGALSGTATRATNVVGGNNTTLLGAIPYQSNTDTTTLLSPNTLASKRFLTQTGTGTNGAAPAWNAIVAADVPTALSSTTSVNGTTIPSSSTLLTTASTLAASNMPAGSIINVQSVNSTTQTSYSGGTTFQTILSMSVTLTPRSSSSKFLLMASINHANSADASGWWNFFRFARGGTGIGVGTAATVYSSTAMIDPSAASTVWTTSFQYVDSPATASSVTYTVQAHPYDTRTMYVNRRAGDLVFNTMSTFVVMEIAG